MRDNRWDSWTKSRLGCGKRQRGAQLEEMLNRHGVQVYGKMICTEDDTYPAFVLVDKSRERQIRSFFAEPNILL